MLEHTIRSQAQHLLDQKTKPVASLGKLETLATQLCVAQNTLRPVVDPVRALIFAGDHGVAEDGVSLYPAVVTRQMMANFASGGAAICVLAKQFGASIEVIDVGVNANLENMLGIVHAKVAFGTKNLRTDSAMTNEQLEQALFVGEAAVIRAKLAGVRTLVLGEMGIANTTAAAAIIAKLTQSTAVDCVGAGTGISGTQLAQKIAVVEQACGRVKSIDPATILRELGGLEIAALVGAIRQGSTCGMTVVIDGFIVSAAALIANAMDPACRPSMLFAHLSAERGHRIALRALDAEPFFDLNLRLGEGSGAALLIPMLRAAQAILRDMASFAEAGVSEAKV
jgi:nicotinate-nucleotide--dimethylbenzimidazole phosphoribosyltransferase